MSRSYQHSQWAKNESKTTYQHYRRSKPTARNPYKFIEMPMNCPSKFLTQRVSSFKFTWIGNVNTCGRGHNAAKGSRRIISGMVRQKVKEETRKIIQEHMSETLV